MIRDPTTQRFARRTHRAIGLLFIVFALILVVTGIMLNHTGRLGLGRRLVTNRHVLRWYGLAPPDVPLGYEVNGHWLIQAGDTLCFDAQPVAQLSGRLVGAAVVDEVYAAATEEVLLLCTSTGELIEKVGRESGLPGGVRRLAAERSRLVLDTAAGLVATTTDATVWTPVPGSDPAWSRPAALPADLAVAVGPVMAGDGLSLERVVRDIHSGRILGPAGVWAVDLAGMLILFLAVTGLLLQAARPRAQTPAARTHFD